MVPPCILSVTVMLAHLRSAGFLPVCPYRRKDSTLMFPRLQLNLAAADSQHSHRHSERPRRVLRSAFPSQIGRQRGMSPETPWMRIAHSWV